VDGAQLAVLQQLTSIAATDWQALCVLHDPVTLRGLLDLGLLIGDHDEHALLRERDAALRDVAWWPPAAIAHAHGRWQDVDIQARNEQGIMLSSQQLVDAFGRGPEPEYTRNGDRAPLPLPKPAKSAFDDLLARRKTCRNFDAVAEVSQHDLTIMLHRVWGAIGTLELAPGAVAVKKNSPAGGGLHAVEAYVLAQRVEGLEPGLYHYLALRHALEPMRSLDPSEAAAMAHRFVAGQHWFNNVPVMVIMTVRFDRLFWKYRRHAKAWRVAHLDAGHLSQTMYLSAADLGLGAFVTAAINDHAIEQSLALAPMREGAIALVGFGPRAAVKTTLELDELTPTDASRR
jgi:putative peptide maturation dehydrogenase